MAEPTRGGGGVEEVQPKVLTFRTFFISMAPLNKRCCKLCSTLILYCFVGTSTDLQCDQCQKMYCSKSSSNYQKKTQHKPVLLLWKMDGEHVDIQAPSNLKTEGVD